MPGMNFNRSKRPAQGASGKGLLHSRLAQRAIAIVGALALAFFGLTAAVVYADGADFGDLTSDPVGTVARAYQNALGFGRAAGDEDPVADNSTLESWKQYMDASIQSNGTANVGRIWTDKSVFTDSITLSPNNIPITKADTSDFLVALSALSSTSNKQTYTDKPLDIVLVLDRSGSMGYQGGNFSDSQIYLPSYDAPETPGTFTGTYYALVNSRYVRIDRVRTGGGMFNPTYEWQLDGESVTPKSYPDDPDGITFYEQSGRYRMDALKEAADNFILSTAEMNAEIPDGQAKHRISVVSFASSASRGAGLTDW